MVLTTLSNVSPSASSTAERFARTCLVWQATQPSTSSPVSGTIGVWPEQNVNSPTLIAAEYGPSASGAFSAMTAFFSDMRVLLR